jgi:hypothetical protein
MRPGQRSQLFSEVNDRIYDLLEAGDPDLPGEFLCECGRECRRRVVLRPAEFAGLRWSGEGVRSPECRGPRFRVTRRDSRQAGGVPALG